MALCRRWLAGVFGDEIAGIGVPDVDSVTRPPASAVGAIPSDTAVVVARARILVARSPGETVCSW